MQSSNSINKNKSHALHIPAPSSTPPSTTTTTTPATFEHPMFGTLRVITEEETGELWFVAKDVAEALGYLTSKDMTRQLDESEKGGRKLPTPGGPQVMNLINESGLYHAILKSRKKEAAVFRQWVTSEVLPSICRHGLYATPQAAEALLNDPDTLINVLTALKREREEKAALAESNQRLVSTIEASAPKVAFATTVATSEDVISVNTLAKLIKQGTGLDIGERRLFAWLRAEKYLCRGKGRDYNKPTQKALELGVLQVQTRIHKPAYNAGPDIITHTPLVTGKGQIYFINLFAQRWQSPRISNYLKELPETL